MNAIFQVPLLKQRLNPQLYQRDYLVAAFSSYRSALWPLLTSLARITNLSAALLTGYIAQALLLFLGIWLLARRLCANSIAATAISLAMALAPKPLIGGSHYFFSQVAHSTWSIPFFLLAFERAIASGTKRDLILCSLCWSAGAYFHLPNAVYCAPALVTCAAFSIRSSSGRLADVLPAAIVAALAVLPLSIVIIMAGSNAPTIPLHQYRQLTFGFTQMHIFWDRNFIAEPRIAFEFIAQTCVFAFALVHLFRTGNTAARSFAAGYPALLLPLLLGYISTDLLHSVGLSRFMWMRVGDWLLLLGLIAALADFAFRWRMNSTTSLRRLLLVIYIELLLLACGKAVTWWAPAAAIFLYELSLRLRGPYAASSTGQHCRPLWVVALIAAAGSGWGISAFLLHAQSARESTRVSSDWRATQNWARVHTPVDSVFLTPFTIPGWRVDSERAAFLELRDRAAIVLDAQVVREHLRRSDLFGIRRLLPRKGQPNPLDAYGRLRDKDFRRLAAQEHLQYAVVSAALPTDLPSVYHNNTFQVLDLSHLQHP
jgi:hypothetical protein